MVAITSQSMKNSVRYARRGIVHAYKTQQSLRVQVVTAAVVIIGMLVLRVSTRDAVILIFLIAAVLTLELINTVVEHLTDMVSPRLQAAAQVVKDTMAGAVLLVSLVAAVVGIIVLWPYLSHALSLS
ncbi:MAG: diacylglycerol kinase family protein [Patescibacteria group bacterium]|jgi:diacylglycerol kinase